VDRSGWPSTGHPRIRRPELPDEPLRRERPPVLDVPSHLRGHRLVPEARAELPGRCRRLSRKSRPGRSTATGWRWRRASLTPEERRETVAALSRYTGLSKEFIDRADLASRRGGFARSSFAREAHRGPARQPLPGNGSRRRGGEYEFDPSMAAIRPPYRRVQRLRPRSSATERSPVLDSRRRYRTLGLQG
jgi:hypothetical protein